MDDSRDPVPSAMAARTFSTSTDITLVASNPTVKPPVPQLTDYVLPLVIRDLFDNPSNFQADSNLDILQVSKHKQGWHAGVSDKKYREIWTDTKENCDASVPSLFLVSVFHHLAADRRFNPETLQDILGRPDYWSATKSVRGSSNNTEVGCQFARWRMTSRWDNSKGPLAPFTIAFQHDPQASFTLYVVAGDPIDSCMTSIKQSMGFVEGLGPCKATITAQARTAQNPFLLLAKSMQTSFEQAKYYVDIVKDGLMGQIGKVNDYSAVRHKYTDDPKDLQRFWKDEGRKRLEVITEQLHSVSQTIDSGMANTDMSIRLTEVVKAAFEAKYTSTALHMSEGDRDVGDLIEYLSNSWHCEMNWLKTYKARKDTTMNFVFNAVTQQDSAISIDMNRKMSRDSSSMNTITILTMVFLPATFVSAVFDSGILAPEVQQDYFKSPLFWPYIATVVPFTVGVLVLWLNRKTLEKVADKISQGFTNLSTRLCKARVKRASKEKTEKHMV
ncbi:uncharacterized protein PV06_10087 [Exophiala oligosperma]|uniref:Uncharacterized protein n=1 Tax=Exophiala oligosperma TaxID=215243 RepID=A0A0D2BL85_9EURO|nr:uncharacterized protein PV06_10087 [Exophiala oligosperma]KIW38127.1 hypothetical protein PV06_10087 [Exophiala oligosperma]